MADWAVMRDKGFAVPDGANVNSLVDELVGMLASPDPQVRDELAFAALATWIDEGVVPDDRLSDLGDRMTARLQDERIQARTFAPLVLDVIVASRGVCHAAWVDAFEAWYPAEDDLRGHDPDLGWLHAVAHGADLLGDLGRHPSVSPRRMLDLAAARMAAPTSFVWRDQEDDRLAHAVAQVLADPRLEEGDAVAWLEPVAGLLAAGAPGPVPAPVTNTLHTLRVLYLVVDRGVRLGEHGVVPVPRRAELLDRLAEVLHPASAWLW